MDATVKLNTPEVVCPAKPKKQDAANTEQVERFIEQYAMAGPPTTQLAAIKKLHDLFDSWVSFFGGGFHMFLSGSYKMNVHTQDADIDVVFVTTGRVSRAQVFKGFVDVLESCDAVTDLTPIPNARVPIICITLDGQEFDIMTCHLREKVLPPRDSMIGTYMWMNGLDEASILAFNGPRVTELILAAVPRTRHFLLAVRFIRLWAKQRCVYSNKSGYLGGVNIVLMVAYVALRNPNANASMLISKTFSTFSKWDWVSHKQVAFISDDSCPVWLKAYDCKMHVKDAMIVMTPCYPRFNTMHAASEYSCRVMMLEFNRANDLLSEYSMDIFEAVCTPLPLASMCKRFLRISVSVPRHGGVSWHGFIESQVRFLLQYLSKEELAIAIFRFIPHWVTRDDTDSENSIREAYITADDDGKIRTYAVKGNINRAFDYFIETHALSGPPQPSGSSVTLGFVSASEVPTHLLVGNLLPFQSSIVRPSSTPSVPPPTTPASTRSVAASPIRVFPTPTQRVVPKLQTQKIRLAKPMPQLSKVKKTKVVHMRRMNGLLVQPYDIYIGREWKTRSWNLSQSPTLEDAPSPKAFTSRDEWLAAYRTYATNRIKKDRRFRRLVQGLHGKTLACWCAPLRCHGHVLADLAETLQS